MLSVACSFRYAVGRRTFSPTQYRLDTTSRWTSRRNASILNPLSWIAEKLAPKPREKPTEDDVPEPSEKPSLFETAATKEAPAKEGKMTFKQQIAATRQKGHKQHKYSTANFKISHRKLNMLGRQISGKPIDHAIIQMHFSEKRASKRIETMLMTAKSHAVTLKGLPAERLVVSEAWVTKGPKQIKRMEPKGRGRMGIRVHPDSRMHVVLKPGKTHLQKLKEERERKLKRIVSAGVVREDVPLRNPASTWSW